MDLQTVTLKQVGTILSYAVFGIIGTAAIALAALNLMEPLQVVVYEVFYLQVGPSDATEIAILTHFLVSGVVALGVVMVAGDLLSDRGANLRAFAAGFLALIGLILVFMVVALAGYAAFLTTLLLVAVAAIAIPLVLRYRFAVNSGGVPAFIGGIPIIVVLLFLAGFGVGWGWGYFVTAEEVPDTPVNDTAVSFDEVPEVQEDLFVTGDCETTSGDRRQCRLQLRGYEHELTATRFLARHGVRCPFQNTHSGDTDALIAAHNETYYRVTCSPHGD